MKFSLIIPCYNEAENLPLLFERCAKLAEQADIEVILVDNGSTDHSPEVLRNLIKTHSGCRSIRVEENQGYGFGVLSGLNAATGEIIGWTHADLQTVSEYLKQSPGLRMNFMNKLNQLVDIDGVKDGELDIFYDALQLVFPEVKQE